jgi:hypothetical protein
MRLRDSSPSYRQNIWPRTRLGWRSRRCGPSWLRPSRTGSPRIILPGVLEDSSTPRNPSAKPHRFGRTKWSVSYKRQRISFPCGITPCCSLCFVRVSARESLLPCAGAISNFGESENDPNRCLLVQPSRSGCSSRFWRVRVSGAFGSTTCATPNGSHLLQGRASLATCGTRWATTRFRSARTFMAT